MLFAFWLASWLLTVLTWESDASGYSVGMAPVAIAMHAMMPIVLGLTMRVPTDSSRLLHIKEWVVAGLALGFFQFFVLAFVVKWWLPVVESPPAMLDLVAGTAAGAILYAGLCAVLSIVGGAIRMTWHNQNRGATTT